MVISSRRPLFIPTPLSCSQADSEILSLRQNNVNWIPLINCPADFPAEIFQTTVLQMINHPEYNSTLILRSEPLDEITSDFPPEVPSLAGYRPIRSIHRRLLPRRPGRDASMEQYCTLYESLDGRGTYPTLLILTPIIQNDTPLPYYHPQVIHLAIRHLPQDPFILRIEVAPLPDVALDLNSRLYRTCLALLDTVHRYGWGAQTNYKKRVLHDCLISRETYQDLYLTMRERHKHLITTWPEVTDPLKHVFEDIGIATYLMLLWKDTFPFGDCHPVEDESSPWRSWPRPPGGFLDFGCGNGLLTHILVSEGYGGHGIDLRARTSWSHYPDATRKHLHVHVFDPTAIDIAIQPDPYLKQGIFIIGNHADELTPWVPVVSTLYNASGYLSIPCCAWTFDSRYERTSSPPYPMPDSIVDQLNLGGHGSNSSSYSMYRIWLASLSLHCGWKVESETLRIPSTRNWALIGRSLLTEDENHNISRRNVRDILQVVRERGLFKVREPEGGKLKDY